MSGASSVEELEKIINKCRELNIETMNQAAKLLLTTSDFTSFCKLHSDNKTNVCDVTYAHWQLRDDNILVFTIEANRFLRNILFFKYIIAQ